MLQYLFYTNKHLFEYEEIYNHQSYKRGLLSEDVIKFVQTDDHLQIIHNSTVDKYPCVIYYYLHQDQITMYHNIHNHDSDGVTINIEDIIPLIRNARIIHLVKTDVFTAFRKIDYSKTYLIIFSKCHKYLFDLQEYMNYYIESNLFLTKIIYFFPENQTETCPLDKNFHKHYMLIDEDENIYAEHSEIPTNKKLKITPNKLNDYLIDATSDRFRMKEHIVSLITNYPKINTWTYGTDLDDE
jgi:hypothetical protein